MPRVLRGLAVWHAQGGAEKGWAHRAKARLLPLPSYGLLEAHSPYCLEDKVNRGLMLSRGVAREGSIFTAKEVGPRARRAEVRR